MLPKIEAAHPELGKHLTLTLHYGATNCYPHVTAVMWRTTPLSPVV